TKVCERDMLVNTPILEAYAIPTQFRLRKQVLREKRLPWTHNVPIEPIYFFAWLFSRKLPILGYPLLDGRQSAPV
ncbi:MAG: hypothetical protein ACLSAG_25000, partial [Bacteroides thetaiotaomicron]